MFPGKTSELQLGPWHGSEKTEGTVLSERHGVFMSAKPGLAPSKKNSAQAVLAAPAFLKWWAYTLHQEIPFQWL